MNYPQKALALYPRTILNQLFIDKQNIPILPITNGGEPEQVIRVAQNMRTVLNSTPEAIDFICYFLYEFFTGKAGNDVIRIDKESETQSTYYHFGVSKDLCLNYFGDENELNRFIKNMIYYKENSAKYIKLWDMKSHEFSLIIMAPFEILSFPTNDKYMNISLAKCVFSDLVRPFEDGLKINGYVKLPKMFIRAIGAFEPNTLKKTILYKTNAFGLMERVNKEKEAGIKLNEISVKRMEFGKNVFSTLIRADGYLKQEIFNLFKSINQTAKELIETYGNVNLVENVYLGKNGNALKGIKETDTKIYFTKQNLLTNPPKDLQNPYKEKGLFALEYKPKPE